ncbi:MAG: MarR family transcriptional regulator [Dehalogenimonas sp.]
MEGYDIFNNDMLNLLGAFIRTERMGEKFGEKQMRLFDLERTKDQRYVCEILKVIKKGNISDFTRFLAREPSGTSQILNRMEEKGMVRRLTQQGSNKLTYELTESCDKDIEPQKMFDLSENLFSCLTIDEKTEFKRLLDKLFICTIEKLEREHYRSPFSIS